MEKKYFIVKLSSMKRRCIIVLMCIIASVAMAGVHTYTNQSVLSKGKFVKISVKETGVHSISYETCPIVTLPLPRPPPL